MLGALYHPKGTKKNPIKFDNLFIPYIYKEIYLDGIYTDIFNQKKDMVVIDVGANLGIVTQYMRDYSKKVYAIEPSSMHFEALKKNKEFNGWDNVEVFNLALSDKDGETRINFLPNNLTCNSITNDYGQGGEMVKTMAFDTFMETNGIDEVDFVKFDVEGAEDLILRSAGFAKVASKIKAIEVEFHRPTWMQLVEYMSTLGYSARRYDCSAIVILFTH
jgi:FkbM family methyltransferase